MKLVTFTQLEDKGDVSVNPEQVVSVYSGPDGKIRLRTSDGGFFKLDVASITDVTAALQATT